MSGMPSSALNLPRKVQYLDLTSCNEVSGSDAKHTFLEPIQCNLCLKICSDITSGPVTEKSLQCDLCKKQTNKPDGVISQINTNDKVERNPKDESSKTLKCHVCYRNFKSDKDLQTHISVQESNCPSRCVICSKEYYRLCHLNTHSTIYTGLRPHLCRVCQKQFFCREDLFIHKKIHQVEKPYSCDECPRKFAAHHHLTLHARVHNTTATFMCDLCPDRFSFKGQLALHLRKHSKYRVKCDVCGKLFLNKPLLNAHKVTHGLDLTVDNEALTTEHKINDPTNKKQETNVCDICHKQFQFKGSLNRHINMHKNNAFKCDLCNTVISTGPNLIRHKRNIHQKYYETQIHCHICMKVFQNSQLLGDHMRMHAKQSPFYFRCEGCENRFPSMKLLQYHINLKNCQNVDSNLDGNKDSTLLKKSPDLNGEEEKPSCDQDRNTSKSSTDTIIEVD